MCGITGIWSLDKSLGKEDITQMTDSLAHRGPDFQNQWSSTDETVHLGHTRLSIIDLSERANQPMVSSTGKKILVYNGETYNFRDLKAEIPNERLKSSSDSEIVLEYLDLKGNEGLSDLNGMFAFAIFDQEKKELLLVRDRVGIKPLYLYRDSTNIAFSSELKSFLGNKKISSRLSVNKDAIHYFLHLGFIPEPLTIFNEIEKVPKGHYCLIRDDHRVEHHKFWREEKEISHFNSGELREQLHSLLIDSVEKQMVSDVPLGTFLSGGTDSSLVSAIASKALKAPIKTFNIGFKDDQYDESSYARKVADRIGSDHNEYVLEEDEASAMIPEMLNTFDQPFGDTSAIPVMLISQLARKEVKVILTGDGGDELFFGYGAYNWARWLNHPIYRTGIQGLSILGKDSSNHKIAKASKMSANNSGNPQSHVFSIEQSLFSQDETIAVLNGRSPAMDLQEDHFGKEVSAMQKQSLFDLKYYLPDDLLEKVDRSSMRSSLECRVPILDQRIVDFSKRLPDSYKYDRGQGKLILKEILESYLPKNLIYRRKWGFSIPLSKWLKANLDSRFSDICHPDSIRQHSLLDHTIVGKNIAAYKSGKESEYNRVWHLVVLLSWAAKRNISLSS